MKCRAEIVGDELVVNGSKIWTSSAHLADWQEMLVRTDPAAPTHKGISWVICDMQTPGIELRPILIMTAPGHHHFNRSEAHTSELQSLMHISSHVLCLKKKIQNITIHIHTPNA